MNQEEKDYCNDCGKLMKEVKRIPQYRADNGELMGYKIIKRCRKFPLFKCYKIGFYEWLPTAYSTN